VLRAIDNSVLLNFVYYPACLAVQSSCATSKSEHKETRIGQLRNKEQAKQKKGEVIWS
jgi:hypothetical protein